MQKSTKISKKINIKSLSAVKSLSAASPAGSRPRFCRNRAAELEFYGLLPPAVHTVLGCIPPRAAANLSSLSGRIIGDLDAAVKP